MKSFSLKLFSREGRKKNNNYNIGIALGAHGITDRQEFKIKSRFPSLPLSDPPDISIPMETTVIAMPMAIRIMGQIRRWRASSGRREAEDLTLVDWKSPRGPPPWNWVNMADWESPDKSGVAAGSSVGVGSGVAAGRGVCVAAGARHCSRASHSGTVGSGVGVGTGVAVSSAVGVGVGVAVGSGVGVATD